MIYHAMRKAKTMKRNVYFLWSACNLFVYLFLGVSVCRGGGGFDFNSAQKDSVFVNPFQACVSFSKSCQSEDIFACRRSETSCNFVSNNL